MVLILVALIKRMAKRNFAEYKKLPSMLTKDKRMEILRIFLLLIGLFFLVIALMQPRWGVKEKMVKLKGEDVIFAVDVSNSMLSQDITPSRIERVKKALGKIMDEYYGGFVGLIAFAGESKIIVPLTLDYKFIKYNVKNLSPSVIEVQGTDFRELLSLVSLVFKSRDVKRKLIVLSDGEDTESNLKESLKIAKESGVKIFTIGVGTLNGARIPIYNKDGKIVSFKKDREGNYVISRLNLSFLKALAEKSGGKFYFSSNIYGNIKKALKSKANSSTNKLNVSVVEYKEKYYYFALIAFIFLFLSYIIPVGRKNFKKLTVFMLIFLFNLNFTILDRGNQYNKKGIKKYKGKKYGKALNYFQRAKEYALYDKKLDLNIGDALYKLGKYDEAEKYFKSGAESSKSALKKFSLYNLGNTYYKKGELKKAEESYKKALKIDPDFIKAKKNLEIVLKKLKNQKGKNKSQNKKKKNRSQKGQNNNKNNDQKKREKNKKEKNKNKQKERKKKSEMKKELLKNLLENLKKQEAKKREKTMRALKGRRKNAKKQKDKDW